MSRTFTSHVPFLTLSFRLRFLRCKQRDSEVKERRCLRLCCAVCDGNVPVMCRAVVIPLWATRKRGRWWWGERRRRGGHTMQRCSAENVDASESLLLEVQMDLRKLWSIISCGRIVWTAHTVCSIPWTDTHHLTLELNSEHRVLFRVRARWEQQKNGSSQNQRGLSHICSERPFSASPPLHGAVRVPLALDCGCCSLSFYVSCAQEVVSSTTWELCEWAVLCFRCYEGHGDEQMFKKKKSGTNSSVTFPLSVQDSYKRLDSLRPPKN